MLSPAFLTVQHTEGSVRSLGFAFSSAKWTGLDDWYLPQGQHKMRDGVIEPERFSQVLSPWQSCNKGALNRNQAGNI